MNKIIIFGAGTFGKNLLEYIGKDRVCFFIDNNSNKNGTNIMDVPIFWFEDAKDKIEDNRIIIAVSEEKRLAIEKQLNDNGFNNTIYITDYKKELISEKIRNRVNYIDIYNKSIKWIKNNSIDGEGIICHTGLLKSYPEVSGYYIPTLLQWGYKDLAIQYAKWLCKIQKDDGSWYNTEDTDPFVFDTGQVLRGLLAIYKLLPEVDKHIVRGVDWLLSNMQEDGRLPSPRKDDFGNGKTFHEIIHIYCLSSIIEAGKEFDRKDYIIKAKKILSYYLMRCREKIDDFDLLSHFYAYVMEGLLDLGEEEIVRDAMAKIADFQDDDGAVPGYNHVHWTCTPGLFQLSLVWFRLGDLEHGNKAFSYACRLQNETGGWFGSYPVENYSNEINTYMPTMEVSWANKYFMDALYWKCRVEFEKQSSSFFQHIDEQDGRYRIIENVIKRYKENISDVSVLDVGCGKGAYISNILKNVPDIHCFATDISCDVMDYVENDDVEKRQGSMTNIPYDNEMFNVVYACESLEHAIDIESAIREMVRVTKPNGEIIIVDKNKDKLGELEIEEWEQWFDSDELKKLMLKYCHKVDVVTKIDYDRKSDGLFYAWEGYK